MPLLLISYNSIKISYLSNYQSSIFGGCDGLVTLGVLHSGLGRLCLTITQPPAIFFDIRTRQSASHMVKLHKYDWLKRRGRRHARLEPPSLYIPSSGILSTGGGLLSRLLIHLLVIFLVCGSRVLTWGWVVGDLVGRPHIINSTKLLG